MKNLCKKYFKSPPPGTCCSVFLEILCDIIKKSSKNCQATTNFLDLFAFVKDIFISYKELRSNYEIPLLQLTNVLCLHLAIEFRYKVCEFTENIFELVISFHKKNDSQLNALIYHFLMTTLSVHNPNGVCGNDKSAYAFSLSAWKFQIKKIYFVCWDTVKMILKHSNTTEFEYELLNLFVDVTHMVSIKF